MFSQTPRAVGAAPFSRRSPTRGAARIRLAPLEESQPASTAAAQAELREVRQTLQAEKDEKYALLRAELETARTKQTIAQHEFLNREDDPEFQAGPHDPNFLRAIAHDELGSYLSGEIHVPKYPA